MIPQWILSALQGRASARERRQLEEWRGAASRHERRYRTLERLWRATEGAEPAVATRRPSAEELLRRRVPPQRAPARASRAETPSGSPIGARALSTGRTARRRWPLRAAVAVAAALVVAAGWLSLVRAGASREHTTGAGEMRTVRLADGSIVRLAPASRLRVPAGDERTVELEGRAFFAVAHVAARPFIVETAAGRVRVLGTRFSLDANDDGLRVAVVEGRVSVAAEGTERELGAGEAGEVRRGSPPAPPRAADVAQETSWLGSTIILQETPLREAAREMRRVHGLTLRIADSALAERTVTAVFRSADADEVLETLCRTVQARCARADSTVVVQPE